MIKNNNNIKTSCCSGSNEQIQDKNPIDKTKHGDIEIKRAVRESYGNIAKNFNSNSGCGCGSDKLPNNETLKQYSQNLGYSEEDLISLPLESNMGLGCGNPVALASIQPGETVVDLGSGAGIDCFLSALKTGETGRVIGVDMTPSMLEKARLNLEKNKSKYPNVEFRLGEIEHLPISDNSVDVVISNCVINLSTDKGQVFKEAYRVLKKGGRMMISDIVITKDLPEFILTSLKSYSGCVAGAMLKDEYFQKIRDAGFSSIEILEDRAAADLNMAKKRKNDKEKPKIIFGEKEIEVESYEEVETILQSVRSINFSAIK
ncbi:MAG: arsenite methyltransferase [Promethearchaeota archaeon]